MPDFGPLFECAPRSQIRRWSLEYHRKENKGVSKEELWKWFNSLCDQCTPKHVEDRYCDKSYFAFHSKINDRSTNENDTEPVVKTIPVNCSDCLEK